MLIIQWSKHAVDSLWQILDVRKDMKSLAYKFVETFKKYDYIVAPSGSCVTMVKEHYEPFFDDNEDYNKVKNINI